VLKSFLHKSLLACCKRTAANIRPPEKRHLATPHRCLKVCATSWVTRYTPPSATCSASCSAAPQYLREEGRGSAHGQWTPQCGMHARRAANMPTAAQEDERQQQ
jgi:hypothetical protein